ncbi:MAG: TerC family protein [Microcella pacifica]
MSDYVIPAWFEIASFIVLSVILIADLALIIKRPHVPTPKESGLWTAFYVGLALLFGFLLFLVSGADAGSEFIAGFFTEKSLSVDNLFVFVLIMSQFRVPRLLQQRVLMIGIILALVFRGVFILLGAALIANFSWIFYIFGAFLLVTAAQQAFSGRDDDEQRESKLIAFLRRRIAISEDYDGMKVRTRIDGRRMFTPLLIVLVAIGITNVIFAIDSIPAIFGITTNPFIVFTANVLALMGLRQLYFLLGHLVDKLEYLKYGIAFILAFIGVKLVLHALHENELPFINGGENVPVPEIDTWTSLIVIVAAMAVAVVASLLKIRREGRYLPTAIVGSADDEDEGEAGSRAASASTRSRSGESE